VCVWVYLNKVKLSQSTSLKLCRRKGDIAPFILNLGRGQLKYDGTRAETTFRLSVKRTSPFKSSGASVQSTTGSRVVSISGSNAGYTMFRGSVKCTGYPLHSPFPLHFPSLASPCVITFQLASNTGYTMFRGSVKSTGYPLHSPVSPSLPRPCVTVCHHISTGVY